MAQAAAGEDFAEYIPHEDFRAGLPAGHFRVVVDPKLARRYVAQRLMLIVVVIPVIGVGLALALTGRTWPGARNDDGPNEDGGIAAWEAAE